MGKKQEDKGRLNLNLPLELRQWFNVACSLKKRNMTEVAADLIRDFTRDVLREHHLPDPFQPAPKPHKPPVHDAGKAAAKGRR